MIRRRGSGGAVFAMLAVASALAVMLLVAGCGSATKPATTGNTGGNATPATSTSEGQASGTGGPAKLALCAELRQAQAYFDKTAEKSETSVAPTEIGNAASTLEREAKMLKALSKYGSAVTRESIAVIENGAEVLRAAARTEKPEFVEKVKAVMDRIPGKEIAELCK